MRLPFFSAAGFARHCGANPSRGPLVDYEEFCADEWIEWYDLTPAERWAESAKLWQTYLALGGSLDPAPDTQSPFDDPEAWRESAAHGRSSLRVVRSGRG